MSDKEEAKPKKVDITVRKETYSSDSDERENRNNILRRITTLMNTKLSAIS